MYAHQSAPGGSPVGIAGCGPQPADRALAPVTGGELLALALSLRARGLRGLDALRRSQDRAPPEVR